MILDKLEKGIVIGDGGALFELERRGYLSAGPFTPEVILDCPEVVKQLHVDFARAGSDVIQAFTYYAHEEKLKVVGMEGKLGEINSTAAKIVCGVADEYGCIAAGNVANTWAYDPADKSSVKATRYQFDKQIEYQLPEGIDFFIAETIDYLGEAEIALQAIQAAGVPSMITLGFKYDDKTLDGVLLEDAFKRLKDLGADIVGINCFRDPKMMEPYALRLRSAVDGHIATQPVAFRCSEKKPYFQIQKFEGRIAFPLELDPFVLTRREMKDYALKAEEIGVNFIGACCGTAPHHIRAMAEGLGRVTPNSKYSPKLELHPILGDKDHLRVKDKRIFHEQRGDGSS